LTRIAAVVVSHGHARELRESLPALVPQVDELVLIENLPGSVEDVPERAIVLRNERPLTFASNLNQGIAASTAEYVLSVNPDAVPEPDAVRTLADFADAHARCGVAGPRMLWRDGTWQPSRRRFPTVGGTFVRRTPLRLVLRPYQRQRAHYGLDEPADGPVQTDWMLGGFLLIRRAAFDEVGGFDEGFRMYGEEIDFCYRLAKAGWERWYVPAAVVRHRWDAVTDRTLLTRRTLWHWRGILRFVRKHPERLRALR